MTGSIIDARVAKANASLKSNRLSAQNMHTDSGRHMSSTAERFDRAAAAASAASAQNGIGSKYSSKVDAIVTPSVSRSIITQSESAHAGSAQSSATVYDLRSPELCPKISARAVTVTAENAAKNTIGGT